MPQLLPFWVDSHISGTIPTPPSWAAPPTAFGSVVCLAFSYRRVKLHAAFTFRSPVNSSQLSGANSKSAYKDRGKQISCLSSDASPVSAVTAWSFYLHADYLLGIPRLRHSMWFGHVDGVVRQTFACSSCHCRTSSSRHAIERKFVGVMLRRAPAGSQVSRQLTETNSYSPSSAYYC